MSLFFKGLSHSIPEHGECPNSELLMIPALPHRCCYHGLNSMHYRSIIGSKGSPEICSAGSQPVIDKAPSA